MRFEEMEACLSWSLKVIRWPQPRARPRVGVGLPLARELRPVVVALAHEDARVGGQKHLLGAARVVTRGVGHLQGQALLRILERRAL